MTLIQNGSFYKNYYGNGGRCGYGEVFLNNKNQWRAIGWSPAGTYYDHLIENGDINCGNGNYWKRQ